MWISLLVSNWRSIAIGGAVLAVLAYIGVLKVEVRHKEAQRHAAVQDLADYRAKAEAEIAQRVAENKQLTIKFNNTLKETTNAYETRLGSLSARYDRLRSATAYDNGTLPGAPVGGGTVVDGAREVEQLPRSVAADRRPELLELLEDADRTREKLTACQDWVRKLTNNP